MDFDLAFQDGGTFTGTDDLGSGSLRLVDLARLVVTSGRIYAGDALIRPRGLTFSQRVPAGSYPVLLSIATFDNEDQRVAFARVEIRPGQPVRWEMATAEGQDPTALAEGEIIAYGVDSGTGSFMDAEVAQQLGSMSRAEAATFSERVVDEFLDHSVNTWHWADVTVDASTGANLVGFASGWGDGFYASYWGYDAHDEVVCLLTDFGIFDGSEDDEDDDDQDADNDEDDD
jgi:hypothetical protein